MSVLILGLDGATWRNLRPWIREGELPNLERLAERGHTGTLQTTIPCTTIPAIPALLTGRDPVGLELFSFTQPDGAVIDASDIEFPMIWDAIGEQHRSLVANLRSTYPPYKLEGTLVSGDLFLPAEATDYVYPPSRQNEFADFHRTEDIQRFDEIAKNPEDNREELLKLAESQVSRKWEHFKRLWREEEYDFGLFWIGKTDSIQHYFWHDQDTILEHYRFVDKIVGEFLGDLEATNRILLSDHGFGQVPTRRFHVNTWLQCEGLLSVRGGQLGRICYSVGQEALTRYVPKSVIRSIYNRVTGGTSPEEVDKKDQLLLSDFEGIPGIDFAASDAFLSFPWGISAPDADKKTISEIIHSLNALRDEEGDQVVQGAWTREEIYSGDRIKEVPEIVFLTTDKYRAVPQLSRSLYTKRSARRKIESQPVTGEHNAMRDGILILDGEGFADVDEPVLDVTEFAPTLVHLLGNSVPSSMSGTVREDLLSVDRSVERIEWERVERTGDRSDDSEEEIKNRLANLGYIDE
ncbi:alkaline phosphatase family protein [Halobellus rubicundus]|uniref:Alkaline phosphatase family protein n=1 Tax=Halobellus rubicundus TaxID=2996466 RepID=A0ABD5MIF1_9EURY